MQVTVSLPSLLQAALHHYERLRTMTQIEFSHPHIHTGGIASSSVPKYHESRTTLPAS